MAGTMTMRQMDAMASSEPVWITHRGLPIRVAHMDTIHIQNAIKCWNGQGKREIPNDYLGGRDIWIPTFENELLNRA